MGWMGCGSFGGPVAPEPQWAVAMLLVLLLGLYGGRVSGAVRDIIERRLNYVSDALAAAARTVVRVSPDPAKTIIAVAGSDEHFLYTWYLSRTSGMPRAGGI